MSDELKLLPCPFCYDGGIDTHQPHSYGLTEGTIYHDNPTCPAQGYHAVAAWNRRVTPAPLSPEVREALDYVRPLMVSWECTEGEGKIGTEALRLIDAALQSGSSLPVEAP